MIHHISIAVNHPQHVADVIAELWQGRSVPFPGHEGSYIAFHFDLYGTAIEVMLELLPPNLMPEYLAAVEPNSLSTLLKNLAAQ